LDIYGYSFVTAEALFELGFRRMENAERLFDSGGYRVSGLAGVDDGWVGNSGRWTV